MSESDDKFTENPLYTMPRGDLEKLVKQLLSALKDIAALDPTFDSVDGFNEWGEAECFNKAKKLAGEAIAAAERGGV